MSFYARYHIPDTDSREHVLNSLFSFRIAHEHSDRTHLSEIEDGAGCTEIWEYLTERRPDATSDTDVSETSDRTTSMN